MEDGRDASRQRAEEVEALQIRACKNESISSLSLENGLKSFLVLANSAPLPHQEWKCQIHRAYCGRRLSFPREALTLMVRNDCNVIAKGFVASFVSDLFSLFCQAAGSRDSWRRYR